MTNEAMNFVRGIAEAYQALEREPELLDRIKRLEETAHRDGQTIAQREERIHQLKGEVEALTSKLREVEKERDDAGFRLLEAEDKTNGAVTLLQDMFENLGETLAALRADGKDQAVRISNEEWKDWENLKAARDAEVERIRREAEEAVRKQQEEEARIRAEVEAETQRRLAEANNPTSEGAAFLTTIASSETVVGQSEPNPTVPMEESQSQPVSSTSALHGEPAALQDLPSQPQGKYFGKKYAEWPYYVSLATWLGEGGTREDYEWKPAQAAS